MNISETLAMLADGQFDLPVQRELRVGEQVLHTGGVLRGSIRNGVVEFVAPYPRAKVGPCTVTISSISPSPPDGAMVAGSAPFPVGKVRRRIVIQEDE